MLWKSSIVNSVKPWDTRSSLLLADTALNLGQEGKGAGHGLLSQQSRGPAYCVPSGGAVHLLVIKEEEGAPQAPMNFAHLLQGQGAHPPHLCNSLLSSSSASRWENPKAR